LLCSQPTQKILHIPGFLFITHKAQPNMSEVKEKITLEDLPAVLYQKLESILGDTKYKSVSSLLQLNREDQIILSAKDCPGLWIDINNGKDPEKPKNTLDIYHLKIPNKSLEKSPYLRVFFHQLFGELEICYLQQPEVEHAYTPNSDDIGKLDAYFYTLGWFLSLEKREYR